MEEIVKIIPADFIKFILVTLFSLLIGLEQRRHYIKEEFESQFGTDRTFTLLGILGFILYVINPGTLIPFLFGGVFISVLLGIFYFEKIKINHFFGITSIVTAIITYCLAPLIYTQPAWLVLLIVVTVLIITELKETLFEFSKKVDSTEFITLAKFLVIAGVVLPLLPDKPISAEINISPYKFWLAIVAISGISYVSYLLKKFVFPKSGIILSGILGGLYSSTATTIILAKKSKELDDISEIVPGIFLATTMMYLRLFLLALFFNASIAISLAPSFGILIVVSTLIAVYFIVFKSNKSEVQNAEQPFISHGNPLEFKTSFLFAALFIFFALLTGYVVKFYGTGGVNILSFIVGVTDIDPFILNLFQSKWDIAIPIIVMAVLNASSSNNLIKMIYAIVLCNKSIRKHLIVGFSIIIVLGVFLSLVFKI